VRSSSVAAFSLTLAVASPVRADDAENFFALGRTLRGQGKCAEAIVAFRRALELKPAGLGSLRNVAECEEHLGQLASARASYWSLRRAVLQVNEPKYEGWDRDAEQAYRRLEPKVAHLTVRLAGVAPERARVTIDGKPLDPRLLGVELERDLGAYTIEATYGGASPLTEKRTLTAGAHEVVTLLIPAPDAGETGRRTAPGDAVQDSAPPRAAGSRPLRSASIAMLTLGTVGAVGLAISVALRQEALSAFSGCPGYMGCDPGLRGELTKGQVASALAFVFGGVAAAGLGAGIPLLVVDSRTAAPTSARVTVEVVPSAGGMSLRAAVRF
jgi:hypothetical protein